MFLAAYFRRFIVFCYVHATFHYKPVRSIQARASLSERKLPKKWPRSRHVHEKQVAVRSGGRLSFLPSTLDLACHRLESAVLCLTALCPGRVAYCPFLQPFRPITSHGKPGRSVSVDLCLCETVLFITLQCVMSRLAVSPNSSAGKVIVRPVIPHPRCFHRTDDWGPDFFLKSIPKRCFEVRLITNRASEPVTRCYVPN